MRLSEFPLPLSHFSWSYAMRGIIVRLRRKKHPPAVNDYSRGTGNTGSSLLLLGLDLLSGTPVGHAADAVGIADADIVGGIFLQFQRHLGLVL